jgi:hypothetical protein
MTNRTHWGVGAQLREVIVIDLDLSHSLAHCREVNTGHTVEVSVLPVRVKVPVVGERWLVDRTFGLWSFTGHKGFNRAKPGLITQTAATYTCANWDFDPTWSNWGWTDPTVPPALINFAQNSTTDQVFGNRDAGWFFQRVEFGTDSTAPSLDVDVNRASAWGGIDPGSYHYESTFHPSGGHYSETFFFGPFWLDASKNNYGPFRFEASFRGTGPTPTHTYFDVTMDIIQIGL